MRWNKEGESEISSETGARVVMVKASKVLGVLAIVGVIVIVGIVTSAGDAPGASPTGKRLERIQTSAQWKGSSFDNRLERVDGSVGKMMRQWIFGGSDYRLPDEPIVIV